MENCNNKRPCTCTCVECARHGKCCACVAYHRDKGEVPGCFFTPQGERLWDRKLHTLFQDQGMK